MDAIEDTSGNIGSAARTNALESIMGLPTEVANDEGIKHTAGTPVAGNRIFRLDVGGVLLISKSGS
jgi:hypothetical protein